jgi:hypothetical protein
MRCFTHCTDQDLTESKGIVDLMLRSWCFRCICVSLQLASVVLILSPRSSLMPPQRRQSSTSKAPQQSTTPSIISTPALRPSAPFHPPSKLKIHPLLETYEATIAALIGTLSEDPFRPESIHEVTRRLLQCESDLEDALEERMSCPG